MKQFSLNKHLDSQDHLWCARVLLHLSAAPRTCTHTCARTHTHTPPHKHTLREGDHGSTAVMEILSFNKTVTIHWNGHIQAYLSPPWKSLFPWWFLKLVQLSLVDHILSLPKNTGFCKIILLADHNKTTYIL